MTYDECENAVKELLRAAGRHIELEDIQAILDAAMMQLERERDSLRREAIIRALVGAGIIPPVAAKQRDA